MQQRAFAPFAVFASVALSIAVIGACTVTTTSSGGQDGGTPAPTPTTTPPPNASGDGGSDAGDGGANACSAEATFASCSTCCNYEDATATQFEAFFTCVCGAGQCQTECAGSDFCVEGGAEPSMACQQCIDAKQNDEANTCTAAFLSACEADTACTAAETCAEDAKCFDKPQQ